MPANATNPPITIEINVERRCALVTLAPFASATAVAKAVIATLTERPELCGYDLIYDLRSNVMGSENRHVDLVAAAYDRLPRTPSLKYSCFVTHDDNFELWALSMDSKFVDRRHRVFRTPEHALAFLEHAPR